MEVGPTADWTSAFPDMREGAPQQPAQGVVPPQQSSPATLPAWAISAQDVRAPAATTTQPPPPQYPTAGPSGDWLTDLGRRLASAVTDAGVAAVSPGIGRGNWSPQVLPGKPATTPEEARANVVNATGIPYYQPQTMAGRATQAALTAGVGGLMNPASLPATMVGGATGQLAQEADPSHPFLANLLGFLAGSKATSAASNLVMPPAGSSLSPQTAQLAQTARDYNIPLAPAQITSNPFIRYFYSETGKLPFSGAAQFGGTQQTAFNRATAATFGETADAVTPDVIDAAHIRIGNGLDAVAQRTPFPMSNTLMGRLQTATDNALAGSRPTVEDAQNQILDAAMTNNANPGTITGDVYQRLTQRNGLTDRMINSNDPEVRAAGRSFRDALDDELQAEAQRRGNVDDVNNLTTLRAQYKALKTVEPLTVRADTLGGARPSEGDISPAALRGAVNQSYTNVARAAPGDIPLNDLAKVGQRFLKEPPDSGTATRTAAGHALGAAGTLGGMLVGGHEAGFGPWQTMAGTIGTLAANRVAQNALRSQWIADRMIRGGQNQGGFQFTSPLWPGVLQAQRPPFALAPPSVAPTPQQP